MALSIDLSLRTFLEKTRANPTQKLNHLEQMIDAWKEQLQARICLFPEKEEWEIERHPCMGEEHALVAAAIPLFQQHLQSQGFDLRADYRSSIWEFSITWNGNLNTPPQRLAPLARLLQQERRRFQEEDKRLGTLFLEQLQIRLQNAIHRAPNEHTWQIVALGQCSYNEQVVAVRSFYRQLQKEGFQPPEFTYNDAKEKGPGLQWMITVEEGNPI